MKLTPGKKGAIAGIGFVLFSAVMIGLQLMLGQMDATYRDGFFAGILMGAGVIFLASRQAREHP
jgi:hypothetical protein